MSEELADGKRFQGTSDVFFVPAVVARCREAVTVVRVQRVVRLFSEKGARTRRYLFGTERVPVRIARGVGERTRAPVFAFVAVDEMLERYRTIISVPVEFRNRAVAELGAFFVELLLAVQNFVEVFFGDVFASRVERRVHAARIRFVELFHDVFSVDWVRDFVTRGN